MKRITIDPREPARGWLDPGDPAQKLFGECLHRGLVHARFGQAPATFYLMDDESARQCARAATELHEMCMAATAEVLRRGDLLERFDIEPVHWERIRRSFAANRPSLTGRFDFGEAGGAFKLFEYNADSAATLIECAVIQEQWARSCGVSEGTQSAGSVLEPLLVEAWRKVGASGLVHFLVDDDLEERFTALYVMGCARKAGLRTRLCVGFDDLVWRDGVLVDVDGAPVNAIWKTWMWESAFADHRRALAEAGGKDTAPRRGRKARLADLLRIHEDVAVFEPLWKVIPSNKGILPVLWELFPGHPNLLRAEWSLTEVLRRGGYVRKPVVGRCGRNISIHGADGVPTHETGGEFHRRPSIFQEHLKLPSHDGFHAVLGAWIVGGAFGGIGIREDSSPITNADSPFAALRVGSSVP